MTTACDEFWIVVQEQPGHLQLSVSTDPACGRQSWMGPGHAIQVTENYDLVLMGEIKVLAMGEIKAVQTARCQAALRLCP